MSFDVNEIVSVCTLTGEFVGKFVVENVDSYEIDDPRLLTPTQNGQYAFLPSVCMSGEVDPKRVKFNKSAVPFVVKCAPEVSKEYRQVVSGLVLPN